ncbi:hypothetical protein V5799_024207 [Amblyomma americanum]|uniref:MADF domain-containing protein n=1 Tax=Amblyomma americanum TaxID=6943 RepID=A0AAQ4ECP8_AMBAM
MEEFFCRVAAISKASWSDDATFYFLALVQQFPTLWDSSRDDFLMCPKKEHLWHSICKQMSSEHPAHGPYSVGTEKCVR